MSANNTDTSTERREPIDTQTPASRPGHDLSPLRGEGADIPVCLKAWYYPGMATITVLPDDPRVATTPYRAVAGDKQAVGQTVGQALDGLRSKLGDPSETTLVIVQPMTPDALFTAEQRDRLAVLMTRWRAARDAGVALPPDEQAELDALVEAEVRAAGERAAQLLRSLPAQICEIPSTLS
jgi:hypothetical protein